jgi:hypothetical protein
MKVEIMTRPQLIHAWYTAVNICIALTAVVLLCYNIAKPKYAFAAGWLLHMGALFVFIIPFSTIILLILMRRYYKERPKREKLYFSISHGFWTVVWYFSLGPTIFFLALQQPWPVSLIHGPDTKYAKACFEIRIRKPMPSSISQIYCRCIGWQGNTFQIRFKCSDFNFVKDLIVQYQLKEISTPYSSSMTSPKWWAEMKHVKELKSYSFEKRTEDRWESWYLWYDPTLGIVWFEYHAT